MHTIREAFPLRNKNGGVIVDDPEKYRKLLADSGYKVIEPTLHLGNPSRNPHENKDKEAT